MVHHGPEVQINERGRKHMWTEPLRYIREMWWWISVRRSVERTATHFRANKLYLEWKFQVRASEGYERRSATLRDVFTPLAFIAANLQGARVFFIFTRRSGRITRLRMSGTLSDRHHAFLVSTLGLVEPSPFSPTKLVLNDMGFSDSLKFSLCSQMQTQCCKYIDISADARNSLQREILWKKRSHPRRSREVTCVLQTRVAMLDCLFQSETCVEKLFHFGVLDTSSVFARSQNMHNAFLIAQSTPG